MTDKNPLLYRYIHCTDYLDYSYYNNLHSPTNIYYIDQYHSLTNTP